MRKLLPRFGLAGLMSVGIGYVTGCSENVPDKYGMASYCNEIFFPAQSEERVQCLNRANSFMSGINIHRIFTSCYSAVGKNDFIDCLERTSQLPAGVDVPPVITACEITMKKEYTSAMLQCLEIARYFPKEINLPAVIGACGIAFDQWNSRNEDKIKCLNLAHTSQGNTNDLVQMIKDCSKLGTEKEQFLCLATTGKKAKEEKTTP